MTKADLVRQIAAKAGITQVSRSCQADCRKGRHNPGERSQNPRGHLVLALRSHDQGRLHNPGRLWHIQAERAQGAQGPQPFHWRGHDYSGAQDAALFSRKGAASTHRGDILERLGPKGTGFSETLTKNGTTLILFSAVPFLFFEGDHPSYICMGLDCLQSANVPVRGFAKHALVLPVELGDALVAHDHGSGGSLLVFREHEAASFQ